MNEVVEIHSRDPDGEVEQQRRHPLLLDLGNGILRLAEGGSVFITGVAAALLLARAFDLPVTVQYVRVAMLGALVFAVVAELTGSYDNDVRFSLRKGWGRVFTAWFGASMAMLALGFFLKVSADVSRGWATTWFAGETLVLGTIRAFGTVWMRRLKHQGMFNQRVAIFGAGTQGDRLAGYILDNKNLTIDLVGFFDARPVSRLPPHSAPLILRGTLDDLMDNIRAGKVDQVIIALPLSAEDRLQEIVSQLAMLPVLIRLAPDLASFAFAARPVVMLGELPVITLFERPISGFDQYAKKVEDLIIGSLLLILTGPILLLTAIAIKVDSPGPVFFRQPRDGYNHRTFTIWKFRSMYAGVEQLEAVDQARRSDPRVTRVGRMIRATSIDELPQLFNVLRGEMSLVGPRPHAPSTRVGNQLFSEAVASYAARHKVKPGVTGWAQVNGWRGETDTEDKLIKRLEHDLFYIENWSVLFDLYIIARTAATVLFSKAY